MAHPGKPRKISPQVWRLVAAELDAGSTYETVQRELLEDGIDVSIATLQKYRREDARKLRARPPTDEGPTIERLKARQAERLEPPATVEPLAADVDLEVMLRRQLQDAAQRVERARSLGDAVVAARESKNMAELTAQLARVQKTRAASRDVLQFSRADIEQTRRSVLEKVAAIVQRPLMCAGCARSLAAALAGVSLEPATAAE